MWSSGDFAADWQRAEPHIIAALHHAGDTHEPADVAKMIMDGRAALWVGDRCAVVTQEIDLPRETQLHFWLAGGDLDEVVEIVGDVEAAAREGGITRISIIGRRGWRAKLDGYREAGVVMTKEIK